MTSTFNETPLTKSRISQRVFALGAFLVVMLCLPIHASATQLKNARIDAITADNDAMSIRDCILQSDTQKVVCNGTLLSLKVSDLALKARLKDFHVGDHVRINFNEKNELQDILGFWSVDVSEGCRILVLIACTLVLLGFATLVTRGEPLKLIVGQDNRYSNSKFQVALWFWILISSYLAIVVFRVMEAGWGFLGQVSIPQNLLLLSGLSALTYGGAKAITTAKVNAANAATAQANANAAAVAAGVAPAAAAIPIAQVIGQKTAKAKGEESFFQDLLKNDLGEFDFGDFQMLIVTLIAVGMYVALFFHFLGSIQFQNTVTLPDLDSTILASFGLGQGAYLTKKAAGNPGTS